jgi:hypothetical protein
MPPRILCYYANHTTARREGQARETFFKILLSQGRYIHTEQHKHRINAHTDIHVFSGIQTHDPSVRACEDSSCLRPRCYCGRQTERQIIYLSGITRA